MSDKRVDYPPRTRIINGKEWVIVGAAKRKGIYDERGGRRKSDAQRQAKELRKRGWKIRIIQRRQKEGVLGWWCFTPKKK